MVFWVGILAGGIFAWFAVKLRLYQTWALMFNTIISIYLAVYLQPLIVNIPGVVNTPYSSVLTLLAIALASFLILQGTSYIFLTGQFSVSFPKVFDTVLTGILGFLAGFLIWSFISLLIYITPASRSSFVKEMGFTNEFRQTSISYISRFCDLINAVVSSQDNKCSAEHTIDKLLKGAMPKPREKVEVEKPIKQAEPEPETSIEEELGPPPDAEIEDI